MFVFLTPNEIQYIPVRVEIIKTIVPTNPETRVTKTTNKDKVVIEIFV